MSDTVATPPPGAATAGALLRQARQAQGLHIAALAAAMKVTQRKLEALEADRFSELPDATFTRALAQAVCRTLKVDAAPVLALLPPPNGHRLEQVAEGLNMPFRERPGRLVPQEWARLSTPVLGLLAVVLIATAVVYLAPAGWFARPTVASPGGAASDAMVNASPPMADLPVNATPSPESAASAANDGPPIAQDAPDRAGGAVPLAANSAPAAALAAPGGAPAAVQFRTTAESWVEVVDAGGKVLISRTIRSGEDVALEGAMPMKVKIGNVQATALTVRGQATSLAPYNRDNIARFELK